MTLDWTTPTLVGESVELRRYALSDADAVWEMVNEPEGRALTATTAEFTREQIDAWVARIVDADERLDWAIVERATGEYAGEVVINEYDADAASANVRISLRGPAWFGRGLGSEAMNLVCDYALGPLGLRRIVLDVLAGNPRAIRSYSTCGFVVTRRCTEDGEDWIDMERTA